MGGQRSEKTKKHICAGLLAHVDAGKTTLSEALLYLSGAIRRQGRVDSGDAFLDHFALERERGITIFSKQASLTWNDMQVTLLDTPGHVDFSAEMERTLQVLDAAVLVISGADGVQGHTRTLWYLLKRYGIPVFLFVNKMDQDGTDREALMSGLKERLDPACVDFSRADFGDWDEAFYEETAVCDEEALEQFLEEGRDRFPGAGEEAVPLLFWIRAETVRRGGASGGAVCLQQSGGAEGRVRCKGVQDRQGWPGKQADLYEDYGREPEGKERAVRRRGEGGRREGWRREGQREKTGVPV